MKSRAATRRDERRREAWRGDAEEKISKRASYRSASQHRSLVASYVPSRLSSRRWRIALAIAVYIIQRRYTERKQFGLGTCSYFRCRDAAPRMRVCAYARRRGYFGRRRRRFAMETPYRHSARKRRRRERFSSYLESNRICYRAFAMIRVRCQQTNLTQRRQPFRGDARARETI